MTLPATSPPKSMPLRTFAAVTRSLRDTDTEYA
jgi:hypothetical protein